MREDLGGLVRTHLALAVLALAGVAGCERAAPPAPTAAAAPDPVANLDLRLVGQNDLQARSAYQPIVHAYGERRILFVGHHAGEALNPATGSIESNGLSILDVTDPAAPQYLAHVPPTGAEASGTQHVQVCDGSALPNADDAKVYAIRTNGAFSYEVLDVTDPAAPQFLAHDRGDRHVVAAGIRARRPRDAQVPVGLRDRHRVSERHGAGLARHARAAGVRLGDPSAPRHVRDFGLAGYEPTATEPYPEPQVAGLHQPFVVGNRMYLGYNSGEEGTLQIVDRDKFLTRRRRTADGRRICSRREIARLDLPSYWGVHTAKPIYDFEIADYADNSEARTRDLLLVASEAGTFRCQEPRDVLLIFDITEEETPLADRDVPSARGARRLLSSRRPFRPALVRRRLSPGVRQEARRARVLQRRRARRRHPQSVRAEGSRALHPRGHGEHDRVVHRDRRRAAVRPRDPNQQREHRRSRLHLRASIAPPRACTSSSSRELRARSQGFSRSHWESRRHGRQSRPPRTSSRSLRKVRRQNAARRLAGSARGAGPRRKTPPRAVPARG